MYGSDGPGGDSGVPGGGSGGPGGDSGGPEGLIRSALGALGAPYKDLIRVFYQAPKSSCKIIVFGPLGSLWNPFMTLISWPALAVMHTTVAPPLAEDRPSAGPGTHVLG